MNLRRTLHSLAVVLGILAGAQVVPLVLSIYAGETGGTLGFLVGAGVTALAGVACRYFGHAEGDLFRREGVLIVVGSWLFASLSGAIPYLVSGAISSPIDALFESASGFTTTGASILVDIESLGSGLLFWRSLTQWLGGVGIVVLFVALLGELGPGARFLFRLEVPGPKAEILHARVRETALTILRIYLVMSALEVVVLLLCGLSLYDALTHTFSTVSTGGFSPYADSMGHFSVAAQLVVTIFMLGAGVNFSLYYMMLRRRDAVVFRDSELRFYAALVVASVIVVSFTLIGAGGLQKGRPLLDALFQVASITTTTGFTTVDFDAWPDALKILLLMLMVVGGCAGSTAGGAKVSRLIVGFKATLREVRLTFSPNAVIAITIGGRAFPNESVRSVLGFLVLWVLTWAVGALLLAVGDTGIVTAATASIATLANIGPGLAGVGPSENYAFFAAWQKVLMILLMLLGRLEFFALLAIFLRSFWRR
ncbi:MAG: TrkH family potassium uptake protein [Myxococcota bacterium]|nr:TrkH family potassium uptake protein [Myxococcota bacterium]